VINALGVDLITRKALTVGHGSRGGVDDPGYMARCSQSWITIGSGVYGTGR